jgi:hypothetical protein
MTLNLSGNGEGAATAQPPIGSTDGHIAAFIRFFDGRSRQSCTRASIDGPIRPGSRGRRGRMASGVRRLRRLSVRK